MILTNNFLEIRKWVNKLFELQTSLNKIDEITRNLSKVELTDVEPKGRENKLKDDGNDELSKISKIELYRTNSVNSKNQKTQINTQMNDHQSVSMKNAHMCNQSKPSKILINVNNNSKVEIREEYDAKDRKIINIVVDERVGDLSTEKSQFGANRTENANKEKKSQIKKSQYEKNQNLVLKSYQTIDEYKKKIDKKFAKINKK